MNNKGWVGTVIIFTIGSILLISLLGFSYIKYKDSISLSNVNIQSNLSETEVTPDSDDKMPDISVPSNPNSASIPESFPEVVVNTTNPSSNTKIYTAPTIKSPQLPTVYNLPVSTEPQNEKCIRYKIDSGDLKSDKCYTENDYYDIMDYYSDYKFLQTTIEFTKDRIENVCDGSDFFKNSCEDAKKDLSSEQRELSELKDKIKKIISRGK